MQATKSLLNYIQINKIQKSRSNEQVLHQKFTIHVKCGYPSYSSAENLLSLSRYYFSSRYFLSSCNNVASSLLRGTNIVRRCLFPFVSLYSHGVLSLFPLHTVTSVRLRDLRCTRAPTVSAMHALVHPA